MRTSIFLFLIYACALINLNALGFKETSQQEPQSDGAERNLGEIKAEAEEVQNDQNKKGQQSKEDVSKRGPDGVLEDPGIPPVSFHKKFDTNFGKSTVYFDSIIPGGAPRDGIPALDSPHFTSVKNASGWISQNEPVLLLRYEDEIKVYPVQILMWHEIINDTVGNTPVGISYAPLTNTAIAFKRQLYGEELHFGTTGRLRFSSPVMYDQETESWWQQATGSGIVGDYAGAKLELLSVAIIPWMIVEKYYSNALVLSRLTGLEWPYGKNPYEGYDTSEGPFLYIGPELSRPPGITSLMDRVLGVKVGETTHSYHYHQLREKKVIHGSIDGRKVVVFWQAGTSSPVDVSEIALGRDVGSAQAFFPVVNGRGLNFYHENGNIRDRETDSIWTVSGLAVEGEMKGIQMNSPITFNHFYFSWSVFKSEY